MVDQSSLVYDYQTVLTFYNSQEWNMVSYLHPETKRKRKMITLEQLLKKVGMERDVIMDEYAWKVLNDESAHSRFIAKLTHINNQNNKRNQKRLDHMSEVQTNQRRITERKRWQESGKINQEIKKQEDPDNFWETKRKQWNEWYHNLSEEDLIQRREENRKRMNNKRQKL